MSKYRVGTRDSLLAVTQTQQVIDELESKTLHKFEMVTMKTTGDLDTSKPLWQMDGKNLFTKELDHSLLDRKIDLMVSSYKDIGSDRPEGIAAAAVTKRKFSNDILLIKKETVAKIATMSKLNVGTSSPRRITNVTRQLGDLLPSESITIECSTLRGNVNTRIQKLLDGHYDAIVLALAGIERLAISESSKPVLEELLKDLTFMVLPERTFPSSPSQGALLLECLESDQELRNILSVIHHNETANELDVERELFGKFGGGCHLAVGISAKDIAGGRLTVMKGEHKDEKVDSVSFSHPLHTSPRGELAFIGLPFTDNQEPQFVTDKLHSKEVFKADLGDSSHIFLTSSYGIDSVTSSSFKGILWVAGEHTFKKAVSNGLWVNGSADSFGESELRKLLESKALQIMGAGASLSVLTSSQAESNLGKVVPCYDKNRVDIDQEYIEDMSSVKVFYWTSFSQYSSFLEKFPSITDQSNTHCTGLGKTYHEFVDAGITPVPFHDMASFKLWFTKK